MNRAADGSKSAANHLLPLVYDELRELARRNLANEPAGLTLQATALVHEAYMRLGADPAARWDSRRHYFAAAAIAMRRILVNHAHARAADKRGGNAVRITLDDVAAEFNDRALSLAALDEALTELARRDPRQARLVELRFFGGMSVEDCAQTLGISVRSVHYEWAHARAWLKGQLEGA